MKDNYSHLDNSIFYVPESIPGPVEYSNEYCNLINDYNSQITHCCKCSNICLQGCTCLIKTTANQNIMADENEKQQDITNNYSRIECNNMCTCSEMCSNRIVQKGPIECLEVKLCKIETKGYGLFTKNYIPKGSYICEYAGEIITRNEALRRHTINTMYKNTNYIFCLNEIVNNQCIQTFIDPSVFGNIGRYINHSCNPNSVVTPVRVNCPIPKLAIFSCSDIEENCEITFNYGHVSKGLKTDDVSTSNLKKCLCQDSQCIGIIPFDPY